MSTSKEVSLPSLSSVEEEVVLARPISGWAIFAIVFALFSLIAPISINLVPLSITAIIVCGIIAFRLSQSDASGGWWLAILGLGVAIATGTWTMAAHKARDNHFAATASEFAVEYLNLLSSGMVYNALELKLPFGQRQSADVDLQAYYEAYTGELNLDPSLGEVLEFDDSDPRNIEKARKAAVEKLKADPVTRFARQYPDAIWSPVEIVQVASRGKQAVVKVAVSADRDPKTKVVIDLVRNQSELDGIGSIGQWRINDQNLSY